MKINGMKTLLATMAVGGLLLGAQSVFAGTMQGICSGCHTMHNSQDGAAMGTSTANDQLLLNTCTGCHTGATGLLSTNLAPIVNHTTEPNTLPQNSGANNHLAGGDFYWALAGGGDDTKAHNVATDSLFAADGTLGNNPPGGTMAGGQLECGRGQTNGCHVADGTHHLNEGGDRSAPTTSVWVSGGTWESSYRFLSGGIQGAENGDWEFTVDTNDHNVYWATADWNNAQAATDTINYFCSKCHGNFHATGDAGAGDGQGGASSPWIRHPTDIGLQDMAAGTEYRNYDTYDWIAPVGANTTTGVVAIQTVTGTTDSVLCVSCHRAHGSPNADMLRWSYSQMNSGTASRANVTGNGAADKFGCFACHSTKD